ncbi:hypothetical protein LXL04_028802 [Taraxacum kok-saghyz]
MSGFTFATSSIFESHPSSTKLGIHGHTYGFIRFIKVADVRLMEEQLNTVKIDGAKIVVNQAKYGKDQRRSNDMSGKGTTQVSRPPHIVSGSPTRNIGLSYRDVLHGNQNILWSGKTGLLLGETSSMKKLENLAVGLKAEGVEEITIKYIGGLRVLVIFESEVAAKGFLAAGKPTWSNWFASLELWSGQKITYQRVAWVKIEGIPFHVWESSCFDSIGGLFGRVISPAHSPIKSMDMSTSCIGILVDSVSRIEEFVEAASVTADRPTIPKSHQFALYLTGIARLPIIRTLKSAFTGHHRHLSPPQCDLFSLTPLSTITVPSSPLSEMAPTKQVKVIKEFQKQSSQLAMMIEMMSESIGEPLDKDEAEEETEELTNQVLDEIGVGVFGV